jgi:hypothetical protein
MVEDLLHVLVLREKKTIRPTPNLHPEEVMEIAQVLHRKLLLQGSDGEMEEHYRRSTKDDVLHIEQQVDEVGTASEHKARGVRLGF